MQAAASPVRVCSEWEEEIYSRWFSWRLPLLSDCSAVWLVFMVSAIICLCLRGMEEN